MACFDRPIFDEEPQVWMYGPVFPEIYHDYKIFGSIPISQDNWKEYGTRGKGSVPQDDQDFYGVLAEVYDLYSPYSGLELSKLTHRNGTPWSLAKNRDDKFLNQEEIKQHFKDLLNV